MNVLYQGTEFAAKQYSNMKSKADMADKIEQLTKICNDERNGQQCNGFSQRGIFGMPFPIFSVVEAIEQGVNATQFVTVKNSKDSIGLFQCFDSLDLEGGSIEKQVLKFQVDGSFVTMPSKFTGFLRVFYEGKLIRSSYQFLSEERRRTNGDGSKLNQTSFEYSKFQKSKLKFTVTAEFDVLAPGMYFVVWKVTDMSLQLYLDAFLSFRVRHKEEKTLILFYRDNDGVDEAGVEAFTKLIGAEHLVEEDMSGIDWSMEYANEWVGYRTQFVREREAKNIRNL